jgi:hypothetical protein
MSTERPSGDARLASLTIQEKKGEFPLRSVQELSNLILEDGQLDTCLDHLVGDRVVRTAGVA